MKKRIKIISLITTLCICLTLFTVGVFAVTQVSFGVTSSMSFTADGVYVKAEGSLKQGTNESSATIQAKPEGSNYSYVGYSYTRLGSGTDPDVPDGSASVTNLVDVNGDPNATWEIGNINFSNTLPVVVYEFTFTNYSDIDVEANITVTQGAGLQTLVTQGIVELTESSSTVTMSAYTGTITSSQKTTYKIVVELLSYTISFPENTTLSIDINFQKGKPVLDESAYPMLAIFSNGDGTAVVQDINYAYGNIVVPSKVLIDNVEHIVTSIGDGAFSELWLYEVIDITLPSTITYIGVEAFSYFGYLSMIDMTKVNLDNLTLGEHAFQGSGSNDELLTIKLDSSVTLEKINEKFTFDVIGDAMEYNIKIQTGSNSYTWNGNNWE